MNYRRLREIEARLQEIREQLRGEGEVDMDALEEEIAALEGERAELVRRVELSDRAADGMLPGLREVEERGAGGAQGDGAEERAERFNEPAEYRDAWAMAMMGRELSAAQRDTFDRVNAAYRAYTHTTENTAILIPETVVEGIWKRSEESYPLWADVQKFHVRGTLTMKRHTGINAGDAKWYDEGTSAEDEENAFAEFTLTGCELAKSVTVSWKLRAMAVADFIPFLEREIGDRMGVALGNGAYSGKGKPGASETFKPEPRGVKTYLEAESGTPQVVTYPTSGVTDDILRQAVAKLHSSYTGKAAVYVNNNTAWTILAGIKDAQKRPIFLTDQAVQGAVGRVFGLPVKVDAAIGDGEILIGDAFDGYKANINEDMTMHTEEHVKARTVDYMGYAIVDGDVFDSKAFALVKKASA